MDTKKEKKKSKIEKEELLKAWELMCTAREMTHVYEENFKIASKYVHATSRGHEAIQIALGMQLKTQDWVSAYYRDDSIMLSVGMKPWELMLQRLPESWGRMLASKIYAGAPRFYFPSVWR